jgi:hypothetical protein
MSIPEHFFPIRDEKMFFEVEQFLKSGCDQSTILLVTDNCLAFTFSHLEFNLVPRFFIFRLKHAMEFLRQGRRKIDSLWR